MPRDPATDARRHVTVDTGAWLTAWRARMWAWWRLQVAAEASLWAASAVLVVFALTRHALAAATAGLAVALWRTYGSGLTRDVRVMLGAVEAAHPGLHNALVTWHEAATGGIAIAPVFQQRLRTQAQAGLLDARRPVARPARNWWVAGAALAVALAVVWSIPAWQRAPGPEAPALSTESDDVRLADTSVSVSFRVTPPPYTGRQTATLGAVDLVEALVGSEVQATFTGMPAGATVRVGDEAPALMREDERDVATFTATRSGLLTVQDAAGRALRTTAIQVIPDAAPLVRITTPGRDLRVADAARVVPVLVTASDDIGMRSLRLLYTRVTGSGETFDFSDGELPVAVERTSTTSWQGSAGLDLAALEMGQGDTLVYYAVARDGRFDAAGLAESERFLIEIPKEGGLAGGDFSLPEPEQRYALSQRMVIQLTERLLERRTRMAPGEYLREAQGLAIQQRRVRAEFVFVMGGDVVDEVEEAEHSHEIEAGRLDNSGQQELLEAVRQMAQAEQRLTDGNLEEALPYEYRALNALQAAFGKARYFMRTLPTTVAIDLSRRGSGDLDLAEPASWQRAPLDPDDVERAREALERLAAMAPASDITTVTAVAEALVAIDPDTAAWLQAVQGLVETFTRSQTPPERQRALDAVADALRARLLAASPAGLEVSLPRGAVEAGLAGAAGPRR